MKQNTTINITSPNNDIEILKTNFPNCFDKNGNFDFEKFKKELQGKEIDFSKEGYGMDWLGKSYARLLASDPATTLLKEDKNWNEKQGNKVSQNLLLKGDNLEVLKHLSNAYHEQVKMIYIDPPYNTGSDGFVYKDDRKFTSEEFQKLAGVDEEKAKKILSFVNSKSNSHSAWLTFMYPRLYIAKQLLKDDGVIFVSIDDNEVAQLRILMDEIFGEENFVGILPRTTTTKGKNDEQKVAISHDYVIVYSKIEALTRNNDFLSLKRYKLEDDRGKYYVEATLDSVSLPYSESLDFTILLNNKQFEPIVYNGKKTSWRWSKDLVDFGIENGLIIDKNGRLYTKTYLNYEIKKENGKYCIVEKDVGGTHRSQMLLDYKYSNNEASRILKALKIPFDYTKPTNLIKKLISLIPESNNSIFLDFFAGSGTTGDAVMQLNAEDGESRKYILVQLPERIDEKKDKTAYEFVKNELHVSEPTIFEITKERLVRAAKKIQAEQKNKVNLFTGKNKLDLGFKVFETVAIWEDYDFETEKFDPQAKLFDESKLSKDDLQTLLSTWKTFDNIPLTQDLQKIDLGGYTGYYSDKKLYLMDKGFKTEHLKKLLEELDGNTAFSPASIIVFGYHFDSKNLREIAENISSYSNKKSIDIDFITRY
ncbi:MAG: site-specific DNA-methyltransferase [Candidatus Azambacteria bacterium]|nr:site-specific DNA-methyltransferase [Candidatus Azambacteria bacterium]